MSTTCLYVCLILKFKLNEKKRKSLKSLRKLLGYFGILDVEILFYKIYSDKIIFTNIIYNMRQGKM